jgi:putative hydrolase of the HAD superfamily
VLANGDLVTEDVADNLGAHLHTLRRELGVAVAADEEHLRVESRVLVHGKPVHEKLLALLDAVLLATKLDDRIRHKKRRTDAPDVHSSQMSHRAVVFDLFGTLIDDSPPAEYRVFLRSLADCLGAAPEDFAAAWARHDIARYTGPIDACFAAICADVGVSDPHRIGAALELRREHLQRILVPRPDALATMQSLRERGLALGMISNASSELSPLWAESAFAGIFDVALFSADERMMKPDPQLYRRMADLLRVEPENCVFVGDGAYRELQGAEAVGMRPILIRAPHDEWEHEGTIGWTGPRVSSLTEVLALV